MFIFFGSLLRSMPWDFAFSAALTIESMMMQVVEEMRS